MLHPKQAQRELHTRVVQEMKAVLLGTDERPYLDAPARELLSGGRHVAGIVGRPRSRPRPFRYAPVPAPRDRHWLKLHRMSGASVCGSARGVATNPWIEIKPEPKVERYPQKFAPG